MGDGLEALRRRLYAAEIRSQPDMIDADDLTDVLDVIGNLSQGRAPADRRRAQRSAACPPEARLLAHALGAY